MHEKNVHNNNKSFNQKKLSTMTTKNESITFTRINGDMYGNPRYVCHFLNLSENYETALKIAHKIGGRKFNNKQYGGGIAFNGNPTEIEAKIKQFSLTHNINPKN